MFRLLPRKVNRMPSSRRLTFAGACLILLATACHAQWDVSGAEAPRYSDPGGRFSLAAPSSWKPAVKNDSLVFAWRETTLTVFFRPTETKPEAMLQLPAQRLRETATDYAPQPPAPALIAGYDGASLVFTATGPGGVASRGRITALTDGHDGMAFVLITPVADFAGDDAAVSGALATLNFRPGGGGAGTLLPEGAPVRRVLSQDVKSGRDHKGSTVWFTVAEPVRAPDGRILVPKDSVASGTVVRSEKRRMFGKPGKLEVGVQSVQAVDGSVVPLRVMENLSERGRSNSDAVAATALILTPLTLFVKGRDVSIKKGTEMAVYVDRSSRIQPPAATPALAVVAAPPDASVENPAHVGS
jgi:hypothetical protein